MYKQIFCKFIRAYAEVRLLLRTCTTSLCLSNWLCSLSEDNALSSRSLFSFSKHTVIVGCRRMFRSLGSLCRVAN